MINLIAILIGNLENEEDRLFASELVNEYYNKVKSVCRKEVKDSGIADEVESKTWELIFTYIKKLRTLNDAQRWVYIYKIIKTSVISYYRDCNAHGLDKTNSIPISRVINSCTVTAEDLKNPEDEIIINEIKDLFKNYIKSISDLEGNILYFSIVENHSYSEISKLTALPKSTVAYTLKKHLKELYKIYTEGNNG